MTPLNGFVGVQVLWINPAALWTDRRIDFIALYGFRLLYYEGRPIG